MVLLSTRLLTVYLVFIACLISVTGVYAENISFLTYNDSAEGYSLSYPEGASLLYASDSGMSELSVLTPENVTIIRISTSNTDDTLENLTKSIERTISFLPGGKIISTGSGRLGGADAGIIDYEWMSDDIPVRSHTIITVNNGKRYSVRYTNRADQFEAEKELIDQLIESFSFIPIESTEKYGYDDSYGPGTVFDDFGVPLTDTEGYTWSTYPYYGWDGSSGYYSPSPGDYQFPVYNGYDPYGQHSLQYAEPDSIQTFEPYPYETQTQQMNGEYEQIIGDGFDYLAKEQYEQAEDEFSWALEMDPSDFRPHYGMAHVLYQGYDGREEEAYEEISLALSSGSSTATETQLLLIYDIKARIEDSLSLYDDALESIEYLIENDEEEYRASDYYLKATVLFHADKPLSEVIEAAEQAVNLDPSNEEYISFLETVNTDSSTETSGGSINPEGTPVLTEESDSGAPEYTYSGGDGTSLEEAVIIECGSDGSNTDARLRWLLDNYGSQYKFENASLLVEEGHLYDTMEVSLDDGEMITIWFDSSYCQ